MDKILTGARPSDLPIELPTVLTVLTVLTVIVNRKTAKALGMAIPAAVLARADEVIE